jgi:hypothetical protein
LALAEPLLPKSQAWPRQRRTPAPERRRLEADGWWRDKTHGS